MSRSRALVAVALLVTGVAPVRGHDELPRTLIEEALSGIDYLPDRPSLTTALGGDVSALVALANNPDATITPGMRIRAYRSLGLFDEDLARAGLSIAITRFRNSDLPIEQLYLIAALEALGDIGGPGDVATLAGSLGHDRRDVRAAAARALGAVQDNAACAPLQAQGAREPVAQVREAVNEALRHLGPLCSFGLD